MQQAQKRLAHDGFYSGITRRLQTQPQSRSILSKGVRNANPSGDWRQLICAISAFNHVAIVQVNRLNGNLQLNGSIGTHHDRADNTPTRLYSPRYYINQVFTRRKHDLEYTAFANIREQAVFGMRSFCMFKQVFFNGQALETAHMPSAQQM